MLGEQKKNKGKNEEEIKIVMLKRKNETEQNIEKWIDNVSNIGRY